VTDAARLRARRLVVAACCLVPFGLLAIAVGTHWQPLHDLDHDLGRWPHQTTLDHTWMRHLAVGISDVFRPLYWLIALLLAAVLLWTRNHRRAAYWLLGVSLATHLLTSGFKYLVDRPRPEWSDLIQALKDPSFPSGHAAQIACTASIVVVLTAMLVRRRGLRRLIATIAVLIALVVGVDRIFLGVHNASDVLAGWLLGVGVAALGLALFDPAPRSLALTAEPLPEVLAGPGRHLGVILNPSKIDDPGQFRSLVADLARTSGYERIQWWETTVEDTGYGMAHEAAVSGASLVLAVGGDGTVRAVCEELAGTGIPVGIVPAGTGNLLARNLDIPLYLRAAVDIALNGQDRAIDMVRVSGDNLEDATFLVMAGMGFDAAIMEGVNEDFKAKVGWLAYVWSALKSLMFPAIRVEISIDDGEFTKHRARTIVIGNVGNLQGGMPLLPNATIDDGEVDVVLLYPRRFLSWLPLAARVLTRNSRNDETITRMSGRTVVVRASADAPRQLDGDIIPAGRELRAECDHGRLLVRVPR